MHGEPPKPWRAVHEVAKVSAALVRSGVAEWPRALAQTLLSDSGLWQPFDESRLLDLFGEAALQLFDALGPAYGKVGQILLSRLPPPMHAVADSLRLTRLYKDWPPLGFQEVQTILDREVPTWRSSLTVDPHPLGVASIAQVHAARTEDGREWVIKIVKPHAKARLQETVAALDEVVRLLKPLAITRQAQRNLDEIKGLCLALSKECSLARERETMARVREKLKGTKQRYLLIPAVNPDFCTENVLTLERFFGTSLADIASGKIELPKAQRQKLAKGMLAELLVQVFELGLFHADPHAGNLMLLDNGSVGLFDWGLTGELLEADRRHIAGILKAVMSLDFEALVQAIISIAEDGGENLSAAKVRAELRTVLALIKKGQADPAKKPSLNALLQACLRGAANLRVDLPSGLLLMAKSLVTIEGLARGIDPDVPLKRVAVPILLKAAHPSLGDLWTLGKKLPHLARQILT